MAPVELLPIDVVEEVEPGSPVVVPVVVLVPGSSDVLPPVAVGSTETVVPEGSPVVASVPGPAVIDASVVDAVTDAEPTEVCVVLVGPDVDPEVALSV